MMVMAAMVSLATALASGQEIRTLTRADMLDRIRGELEKLLDHLEGR
jgi:hypothetical protein